MKKLMFVMIFSLLINALFSQTPELKINAGHGTAIRVFDISPDQKYIVSGDYDNVIKLWDVSLGKEIRTFSGHSMPVKSVCFSPDGKYFASGSQDKTIIIWDIKTGKALRTNCCNYEVESIAYTPDGKFIVAAAMGIYIIDINTGEKIKQIKTNGYSNYISISPDGNTIASSEEEKIAIRDINTGDLLTTLSGHKDGVNTVNLSKDGKYLVSCSSAKVKLWDVNSKKNIYTFSSPDENPIYTASLSPDMKNLAIACINSTVLVDLNSKKIVKQLEDGGYCIKYTTDGKAIVETRKSEIKFYTPNSLKDIKSLTGQCSGVVSASFTPNGESFVSADEWGFYLWDINTAKMIRIYEKNSLNYNVISVSPDGKLLAGGNDSLIKIYDLNSCQLLKTFKGHSGNIISLCFSPDSRTLASVCRGEDKTFILWDIATGNKINIINDKVFFGSVVFSPDGKLVACNFDDDIIRIWDANSGDFVCAFGDEYIHAIRFTPNSQNIVSGGLKGIIKIRDAKSGKKVNTFDKFNTTINSIDISPNGKFILCGNADSKITLLDAESGETVKIFSGHIGEVSIVQFSSDGEFILSGGADCTSRIWNINTSNWVAFLNSTDASKELVFTKENYWDGTPNCSNLVSMVKGLDYWNIDQFAVKNNRPDIILQQFGSKNEKLITHYYSQYQKRLRKLGLSKDQLSDDYHVPFTKINETNQNNKFVDLKFNISDQKYNLKSYNIYVNDIPIFGAFGKDVKGNSIDLSEKVELISGENKIEISCMNEKGAESFRALTFANYSGEVKKDLYILAFGVSKYQNSSYNLQYADKDATDLSIVIEGFKNKGFANVYTKVITNEQVTPEAIKASKDFVKNAKPDDTFILFIAGHGMHDKDAEATYYYLTSNADINNLKGTAADFETIEDLLQGIPPRNKLFLMDACESGEIDEEDQGQMIAAAAGAGINSRGFKSTSSQATSNQQRATKRSYLYQKDRYIYNDLARRSGAIVFSSSKGGELSYERSDIENGLFTEYIMKALTTDEADKDGNGTVSTDELRQYVSAQVAKASGDLQHPTVDRDNIYQEFGFGVNK